MDPTPRLLPLSALVSLIESGACLCIAGDETLLTQLPAGNWIATTTPYFMTPEGGRKALDQALVTPINPLGGDATLTTYDEDSLHLVCRNAPGHGYTLLLIPAFGPCHGLFAENAPNYEDMYLKPLVGWVAGMDLEGAATTPKVMNGRTRECSDQIAVALHIPLPPDICADIRIINLFEPDDGASLCFGKTGFSASQAVIDGVPTSLADYIRTQGIDTRLPLVADYSGALVNVSIKEVGTDTVTFYAPVFEGIRYRFARPVENYVDSFKAAMAAASPNPHFSCNCILNYLYADLPGRSLGNFAAPITFGEIAYQLLNQTFVYLELVQTG